MSRTIHAFIFAFIVGGLVGYALSTSQALTAAAAVADAVPIPDVHRVEVTAPTPMLPCPQSQDIANIGAPAAPTKTHATDLSCVPPPCVPTTLAKPTEPTTEPGAGAMEPATEELVTEPAGAH